MPTSIDSAIKRKIQAIIEDHVLAHGNRHASEFLVAFIAKVGGGPAACRLAVEMEPRRRRRRPLAVRQVSGS
jgi:hypothetical protein